MLIVMQQRFKFELILVTAVIVNEQSNTILKGIHPCILPFKFGLIYFSGLREEDSNMMFHQTMSNLHNRNKSA